MKAENDSGAWHVYLVRTAERSLYTGIAKDVGRRLEQHGEGRGAKYLRGRGPLSLVYQCEVGEHGIALRVEHALKRLSKDEKELVVRRAPPVAGLLSLLELEG